MLTLVNQSGENTVADIPAVSFSLQQIPLKIHPEEYRGVITMRLITEIADCLIIHPNDAAVVIDKGAVQVRLTTIKGE